MVESMCTLSLGNEFGLDGVEQLRVEQFLRSDEQTDTFLILRQIVVCCGGIVEISISLGLE